MWEKRSKKTVFTLNIYDGSLVNDVGVRVHYLDGKEKKKVEVKWSVVEKIEGSDKIRIGWEPLTEIEGIGKVKEPVEYVVYLKGKWDNELGRTKETQYELDLKYAPQVTEITYPLIKHYADKIGADFYVIKERKFPGWPIVYEKLQIYELAQEMRNDWNLYIDSDTLIHPDFYDVTEHLRKDTVAHNGRDMAGNRWFYDRFFKRDGRHIGSCNWFAVASDWCIDLWKPLDDLTLDEAIKMISPTTNELTTLITPGHLIDDFTLSRNIAKYGLKYTTFGEITKSLNQGEGYLYHQYTIPIAQKVEEMKRMLATWGLT